MTTIFTKILSGEIPCHKIAEDDRFFAFLDIRPVKPGHTLVIPKKEIDYFFDLDDELLSDIMLFSRNVAKALEKVISCKKVGIMVAGLEVPHAHIHLIPFDGLTDLNFSNAREADQDRLAEIAASVREQLS